MKYIPGLASIVIPNWNGKRFLAGCLDSLKAQTYKQHEVVIVDNGSHDGSVEFLREHYPEVRLVTFTHNTGFSVAVNRGIMEAAGQFVALLNNDTVVDENWLAELIRALNERPEASSAGCKMLGYDDRTLLDGAGDGYRRGGLPGRIGHRERDTGRFNRWRYILGACGGAAIYRRELFDEIGMLDEDYFAYLEDVDFGLRAQSAGHKCVYAPEAIVYHLGCGTTGSGYSALVVRLSAQNNWNTIVKNIPGKLLLKFMPQILYWQLYYLAVVVARSGQLIPWFEGTCSAVKMLPKMLEKRKQIQQSRKVSERYLETIIFESECDLATSKSRLNKQTLAQLTARARDSVTAR